MEILQKPSVFVANDQELREIESYSEDVYLEDEKQYSTIASYISEIYRENKDARTDSGVDTKMLQSLRAYNGHYDPEDIAMIRRSPGGSEIYMNLTPTKCRAAMSWIRDILMPAKERAWSLSPTAIPSIPPEVRDKIKVYMEKVAQEVQEEAQAKEDAEAQAEQQALAQQQQEQAQAQGQEGQPQQQAPPPKKKPTIVSATQKLQVANKIQRDVEEALLDEVYKLAEVEVKKYENIIADRFDEGEWDKSLSEFIEDFCVFPVAVMKGPIITKRTRLTWVNGQPQKTDDFVYLNRRVSPLDIYPSPSATCVNDGNICEHLRLTRMELYSLIGVEGYNEENIRKVLQECSEGITAQWLDDYIEDEKAFEEYRGETHRSNKNIIHGIHFFGTLPYSVLLDWGFSEEELGYDEDKEFEVEAMMAGNEVIKCVFNDDPLLRRPYYKASFQNIPGSWWGRSLPELMRDIQRVCNATARALANNMGIASGPQIEVYMDRLAADEDIEEQHPFKIWQVTSDPTGAGGRAINWWQPSSNAQELLAVYKEFELRADDATGIPRYAYGNERVGGAAQALADYEPVITPSGIKKISKLIIGDKICNTYGGVSKVTGVYPQGLCEIFRVKFSNGEHIDCDMNHRWSVRTHHNRSFRTLTLEEILDKGLFRKTNKDKKNPKGFRPKWMLPTTEPIFFNKKKVRIDPYTFGAILGDGDSRGRLTSMDQEIFDRIPYNLGKVDIKPGNKAWSQTILGIKKDLRSYIGESTCYTKFIPEDYLKNSVEVRTELLKGMMDTDGCISKNGECFYFTVSKELADNFKDLVRSLGGTIKSVQVREDPRENRVVGYRIHFNTTFPPVYLKRKLDRWRKKPLLFTYITGVEYVGKNTATCITVDSEDSLFLTRNFIPTHNTASGLSMLLESASKGIKDAVRHIDEGLIIPRVQYQFYWEIITNPDDDFSGDVQVVPKGSSALTMKGAIEMRRNEFLQIVGNPTYMGIIGEEGVAEILREMAKTLGLGENIVPSRIEIRRRIEEMKEIQQQNAQGQQQVEQQKAQIPLQTVQMQTQAADAAAQRRDQLKQAEIQANMESKERDRQVRLAELEARRENEISKVTADLTKQQMADAQKDRTTNKNIALSIESDFKDKNNQR